MTDSVRKFFFTLFLILGWIAGLSQGLNAIAEDSSSVSEQTTEGFHPLFNGKNLDGWYTFLQEHGRDSDPDRIITIEMA